MPAIVPVFIRANPCSSAAHCLSRFRLCYSAIIVCCVIAAGASAQQAEPANFVLQGGKIYTLDAKNTVADALAIRDGKIAFVGSDQDAAKFIGPKTTVYQAAGRAVI